MSGRGFRLGEVYETVKGKLDLVTESVGSLDDSIEEFANLDEEMDTLREFGNEKRAYSCTSKNMDMVEMDEELNDEFSGKVLNYGVHVYGVEFGI